MFANLLLQLKIKPIGNKWRYCTEASRGKRHIGQIIDIVANADIGCSEGR